MDYDSDSVFPVNKTGRDSEIRNLLRHGKVTEVLVDETQVCVRVQWLDKKGLISKPLPVQQFGSRSTSSFWCPKVADDVTVMMLPNGSEDGFVIGSFYNTGNPPPIIDPDTRHVTYADGTTMEYRESLPAIIKDGIQIRAGRQGQLTINSPNPISITCSSATIICSGNANIKASTILLDAPNTKITGMLWVDDIKPYQKSETTGHPHVKNEDGSGNGS
jgi:phage baseplate assembly protein V